MPLFKTNEYRSVSPGCVAMSGQFVIPANVTTPNLQIANILLPSGSIAVSQLTPIETVSPQGTTVPIYCTPNGSVGPAAGNGSNLPKGIAAGAQTAGSEFIVDCSGLSADIISAQAAYMPNVRGSQTVDGMVSAVDNVNKLVYVQCVNRATGAPVAATAGAVISYQVVFKDSFVP